MYGQCFNRQCSGKILQFKLVLLGEAAVGKSSLVLRFVKGHFQVILLTTSPSGGGDFIFDF